MLHPTSTVPQLKLCTPKLCAQAVHIDCAPKLMDQGSTPLCTCHIPMSIATTGLFFKSSPHRLPLAASLKRVRLANSNSPYSPFHLVNLGLLIPC
jgi:hypothetical protein